MARSRLVGFHRSSCDSSGLSISLCQWSVRSLLDIHHHRSCPVHQGPASCPVLIQRLSTVDVQQTSGGEGRWAEGDGRACTTEKLACSMLRLPYGSGVTGQFTDPHIPIAGCAQGALSTQTTKPDGSPWRVPGTPHSTVAEAECLQSVSVPTMAQLRCRRQKIPSLEPSLVGVEAGIQGEGREHMQQQAGRGHWVQQEVGSVGLGRG
jgi:hypothetical protein